MSEQDLKLLFWENHLVVKWVVSSSKYFENIKFPLISWNFSSNSRWNVLYPVDPNDQLSWLASTLLEAEKSNEKVHILSHIPPGSEDTMQVFQREYRKIINRYVKP